MTYRAAFVWVLLSWACLASAFRATSVVAAHSPLVAVVGAAFPVDDISYADLRSVFRGQPIKLRGSTLIPINHPLESRLRVLFDEIVLGLSPESVGSFWVDMRIRDQGTPPTTASTPQLALRMAAALPGAVSYATEIAVLPMHKVLTVDGKKATDYGYPIKP